MRVDLTVWLGADDDISTAEVLAALKDLGVQSNECDADGRRWFRVSGDVSSDDFDGIIMSLKRVRLISN